MAMLFSKVLFDLAENLISSYLYPLKCECEVRRCLNEKYLHYRHKTQIYSNFYKFFCPPQKLKFYPTYGYEKKMFENWQIFMHLYLRCNQMHFEWILAVNLSKIETSI